MDYGTFINHCEQHSAASTYEIDDAWGELFETCRSKNLHISQMYGIVINTMDKDDMVSVHNGEKIFTVRLCDHKCVKTSSST